MPPIRIAKPAIWQMVARRRTALIGRIFPLFGRLIANADCFHFRTASASVLSPGGSCSHGCPYFSVFFSLRGWIVVQPVFLSNRQNLFLVAATNLNEPPSLRRDFSHSSTASIVTSAGVFVTCEKYRTIAATFCSAACGRSFFQSSDTELSGSQPYWRAVFNMARTWST